MTTITYGICHSMSQITNYNNRLENRHFPRTFRNSWVRNRDELTTIEYEYIIKIQFSSYTRFSKFLSLHVKVKSFQLSYAANINYLKLWLIVEYLQYTAYFQFAGNPEVRIANSVSLCVYRKPVHARSSLQRDTKHSFSFSWNLEGYSEQFDSNNNGNKNIKTCGQFIVCSFL